MKLITTYALIVLFTLNKLYAQSKFEIGANYIHQYVAMLGEEIGEAEPDRLTDPGFIVRGLGANVQITYKATKNVGFKVGLTYSKEGCGLIVEDSYYERQLSYVKLPVEFYVSTNTNKRVSFGISFGVSANYLTSANHLLFLDYDEDFMQQTGANTDEELIKAVGCNSVLKQKNDDLLLMDYSILGITENVDTKKLYKPMYLSAIFDINFRTPYP